jgi:hypothetical protein
MKQVKFFGYYTGRPVTLSELYDLIPEVIPSQKCHMNIGQILNSYGATDI